MTIKESVATISGHRKVRSYQIRNGSSENKNSHRSGSIGSNVLRHIALL